MEQSITVYAMLLHPDATRFLLVPSAEGWGLPRFTRPRWELWACVSDVNEALREQFGIVSVTLRCHAVEEVGAETWLVYAIEYDDPAWTPPAGCRWASCDEIREAVLLPQRLADIVVDWFVWETCIEPRRVPWYRRGWLPPAIAWIERQAAILGMQLTGPPLQRRTCQRSAVWEVPTTDGPLFFKAVPEVFRHELALTEYLAALFPDDIPRILAADHACGWMLMANAGEQTLGQSSDLSAWRAALHRYAEMQVELSRHVDRLIALGCPRLPPARLGDALVEILTDDEALTPADAEFQLTPNESAMLREHHRRLDALGRRLASSPIPLSLDHGDFWSAQMLQHEGNITLIDWSDATVTMPFFSLFKYFMPQEVGAVFPNNPDAECSLRDAYLDPWTTIASRDQLTEWYRLAETLAPLHYAVYNHRFLMPWMEIRWENGNMAPYFLKLLVVSISGRDQDDHPDA